ncbi:hypothetical protein [Bradyrhizobium sp. SZCCHNS3051]|uniref:hypothetical protein n=1 Tax=Bradyrhizobium sp. SZCCHNS3051 TaxID=3057320 RepID=UPI002916B61E|nr:hypothetical protein [Bradyrhizobium sp. SZCCHNS3051]
MLAKAGEDIAADVDRLVAECQEEYGRLRFRSAGLSSWEKDFPEVQRKFDRCCEKVALRATAVYRRSAPSADGIGRFHARIDALKVRFKKAAETALTTGDLHLPVLEGELEAIDAEIAVAENEPPMDRARLAYDGLVTKFKRLIGQLVADAQMVMSRDSDLAVKLGLLSEPSSLRRRGEEVSAVAPDAAQLEEFTARLAGVVAQIEAKLEEIGSASRGLTASPDKIRQACIAVQKELQQEIKAVLTAVEDDENRGRFRHKLDKMQREAMRQYGAALTGSLVVVAAAAAPGASFDVALLKDTRMALERFRDRVEKFKGMLPDATNVMPRPRQFSEVHKLLGRVKEKLDRNICSRRARS